MSAPAAAAGTPTLRIRGTSYPVLLPKRSDPRLHLAAVIVSLQVLGQVAFDFRLSIAQILVCLLTCAVLEVGIAFRRQHVLMWPASALLTGNGVAFILRVPGTEHGDWWSMHGWWIFAALRGRAPLQVPDPVPRTPRLQPVQLRARPRVPDPRLEPRRSARVLVGAHVGVDGARARDHRRRRARDPLAAAAAGDRGELLDRLCGRHRRARGERSRDDRAMAPRADHGLRVLAGARFLARDPRLPLLHDHGPEDDSRRPRGEARVRRGDRPGRRAADRAADDRVRDEGRRARGARARLRGEARGRADPLALACARAAPGSHAGCGCRPGRRGHVRGARRARRHPCADERGRGRAGGERVGASRGDRLALRRRRRRSSTARRRSRSPATSSPAFVQNPKRLRRATPSSPRPWPAEPGWPCSSSGWAPKRMCPTTT